MSKMIERVARGIWEKRRLMAMEAHGIELEGWGDGSIPRANHIFEEARAAIEAMREPTDPMICAVLDLHDSAPRTFRVSEDWRAMIDAALQPS